MKNSAAMGTGSSGQKTTSGSGSRSIEVKADSRVEWSCRGEDARAASAHGHPLRAVAIQLPLIVPDMRNSDSRPRSAAPHHATAADRQDIGTSAPMVPPWLIQLSTILHRRQAMKPTRAQSAGTPLTANGPRPFPPPGIDRSYVMHGSSRIVDGWSRQRSLSKCARLRESLQSGGYQITYLAKKTVSKKRGL